LTRKQDTPPEPPQETRRGRRLDWLLFVLLFGTYAFFFQGGGWNQNGRFDQVRAVVEQGRFSVNDYLLYRVERDGAGRPALRRYPVPPGLPLDRVADRANTGDLTASAAGHRLYPNKPPGATLLAVPGYFLVHHAGRVAGLDAEDWWGMTLAHYLTTLLSTGLIGALGGVLFLHTSRRLLPAAPPWTHVASALTFGLATPMLPFATMLFDHVQAGVLLLLSFHCLLRQRDIDLTERRKNLYLALGGAAAGSSVVVNYLCAAAVLLLAVYALRQCGPRRRLAFFVLGGLPAAVLLAAYHAFCFGTPFTVANAFQHEIFSREGLLLGVFGRPNAAVAWGLLFGPRRGLFLLSPVLLAGLAGGLLLARRKEQRAAAAVFVLTFLVYWLANASFEHWHGGFSLGPRYLVPALPFLCLPLAAVFQRLPRLTLAAAAVSLALVLSGTAADAQVPTAFDRPWSQYLWPLMRAGSVTIEGIRIEGPVSANPIGSWESWYYRLFPPGSPPVRWSSFNLGEFLWPGSLASLIPLALFLAAGLLLAARWTRPRSRAC